MCTSLIIATRMPPIVVEPSLSGLAADCHIINIFQTFTFNPYKDLCCSIFIFASFQQFTQCFNTDYSVRGHRWNVSASAMIMILSYFIFFSSKSSPNPAPIQLMIVFSSSFFKTSTILAFKGFKVLPLKGSIAWNFESLPCLAEPPALSSANWTIS